MKNLFWRKRWLVIGLLMPTLMLLTAVGVYAATMTKPLPATVTVNLQSTPDGVFGFYSDAQGSVPITTINFGQLKPGVSGVANVYIKNLTIVTKFNAFSVTDDLEKGTTSIFSTLPYHNPPGAYYLAPGEISTFEIYLNLDPLITAGTYNFVITVSAQTYGSN